MKFSELWLREWINTTIDSKALVNQITMSGLEVDSVEPVANQFTGVIIGRIVECYKHSHTDKLHVTKVDVGGKQLLDIVCSAPNCRINLRVAVAMIGAVLSPNNLRTKADRLRNVPSEGMLCSFPILGINIGNDNIIELPNEAPIGQDIREYLQLDDNIININVAPNRADCLGLLGIARNVAVSCRLPLHVPTIKTVVPLVKDTLPIRIDAIEACPRYLSRVIKNIDINTLTPLWMQEKLRRCGLRSVNIVMDVTNYVMLELGQPVYAFDCACIDGGIVVRYAKQDEICNLLNGNKVMLSSNTLVIADHSQLLAIAGIIGSSTASISQTTYDIVLECAFFSPLIIANSVHYYRLHTDTACRYERGVDPTLQPRAMERVTALLLAICGGHPGPVVDLTSLSTQLQQDTIILHRKTIDRLLGYVISDHEISDILIRLGCYINYIADGWQVVVPSWRFDIIIEEDLIEEIMRVYGYDKIPNVPVHANLITPYQYEAVIPLRRIKTLLVDLGYQEVITYSFVNPKIQALIHPQQVPLVLPNPISQDMSVMRLSLLTGLLGVVVYNQNRQQQRIRLFESGLCFIPDKTAELGVRQHLMLAGVITGPQFNEHWDQPRRFLDFYDAKGDLEVILEFTGKLNDVEFKSQRHPALHPGQSAKLYINNKAIGLIGVIHPQLSTKLNLNGRIVVFEIFWEKITNHTIPKAHNISRFPVNRRDITVIVTDDVAAADIIAECKKINVNQLIGVNLFDIYRGKGVKEGFKSLSISLILQGTTRTLEEEEISAIVTKCVVALKQRFQVSLRDEIYGAY